MKIGWVPFINLVPMRYEFNRLLKSNAQPSNKLFSLNEIEAVPKGLNEGLLEKKIDAGPCSSCLLYTSPSPRDQRGSRMPSSA